MKMRICSVKKLNKRQCRNKCQTQICEYHRYHPYLNGPMTTNYLSRKRRYLETMDSLNSLSKTVKRVRFSESKKKSKNVFLLSFWNILFMFVLLGLGNLMYNTSVLYSNTQDIFEYFRDSANEYSNYVNEYSNYVYEKTMDVFYNLRILYGELDTFDLYTRLYESINVHQNNTELEFFFLNSKIKEVL